MKNFKWVFVAWLFILVSGIVVTSNEVVFADDDEEYEHHGKIGDREDEALEEVGELVGWGTVIFISVAGLIYPTRRLTKFVITNFPTMKQVYLSVTKFFGKYHIYIGIIALLLSIIHGLLMYLSEGELESEGIVGLGAVLLMIVAGIVGAILYKNKKVKNLRFIHATIMSFAIIVGVFHIFIS